MIMAVDEITAWWQKTLGTKAVLGQASNRPPPGPRAPIARLLWTKPDREHTQQEKKVVEATPRAVEKTEGNIAEAQVPRGRLWMARSLTPVGQIKHWPGVILNGTLFFLAVMFLRFAVAVFEAIRSALAILTMEFRRVKRWSHSVKGLVAANESQPGKHKKWKSHAAASD